MVRHTTFQHVLPCPALQDENKYQTTFKLPVNKYYKVNVVCLEFIICRLVYTPYVLLSIVLFHLRSVKFKCPIACICFAEYRRDNVIRTDKVYLSPADVFSDDI